MFRFRLLFACIGALACLMVAGSLEWLFRRTHLAERVDDRASRILILRSERTQALERAGGSLGDVQITLSWNNRNDLDLSCVDPNNEPIWYENRFSRSGGLLELDSNNRDDASHPLTDHPIEHIYWPYGRAPLGTYRVYVCNFRNNGDPDPTRFKVTIWEKGRQHEVSGTIAYTPVTTPLHFGHHVYSDLNRVPVYEFSTLDGEAAWSLLLPDLLRAMLITGVWCGLLGLLFTTLIWAGQDVFFRRCYKRRMLKTPAVWRLIGWGGLSGWMAGMAGQLIFSLLTVVLPIIPLTVGCYLGWVLMGALFGGLIALRMPNLPRWWALGGGSLAGWLGGIAYLLSLLDGSGAWGRLEGAAALGALVGVMVTLFLPYKEIIEPLQDLRMRIAPNRLRPQRSGAVGTLKRG